MVVLEAQATVLTVTIHTEDTVIIHTVSVHTVLTTLME
jgi:hypothetical protein